MEAKLNALWAKSIETLKSAKKEGLIKMPENVDEEGLFNWFKINIPKLTACMDEVEKKVGTSCVCSKGCGGCCKQAIQVLSSEAIAIKVKLQSFSKEELQKLYVRVIHHIEILEKSGLDTDFSHYYSAQGISPHLMTFMKAYFELGLNCPLLSEEGACMIYEVRPGGCWGYRVYAKPEECKAKFQNMNGIHYELYEDYLLKVLYRKRGEVEALQLLPYWLLKILEELNVNEMDQIS